MAKISSFNINDISLYYQALQLLAASPLKSSVAAEQTRERLVTYLEYRRAKLGLTPLRGQLTTLGEKALIELRQMQLAERQDQDWVITPAGLDIVRKLESGEGREARRMLMSVMIDTFENLSDFIDCITPPRGRPLLLPIPRSPAAESDEDEPDGSPRVAEGIELETVCDAWAGWCNGQGREDLVPHAMPQRAAELFKKSRDKSILQKIENILQQLVLEKATGGVISKNAIYRTIRDRLNTVGATNSRIKRTDSKCLSVEKVYSCLFLGDPPLPDEWVPLKTSRIHPALYVHEPPAAYLAERLLPALIDATASLSPRAEYFRIYELRSTVCEALGISQGVFDSSFVKLYKANPSAMTLGVDYETVTAKRLPIEIREGGRSDLFNLVAFRDKQGE